MTERRSLRPSPLMMKARADDRHIFDSEATLNILTFENSQGINVDHITYALNSPINKEDAEEGHVSQAEIASLLELFDDAMKWTPFFVPENGLYL